MINIVTAFAGEARPLIDYFQLTEFSATGRYTVYRGDDRQLVISGPGKVQAAAATGWLQGIGMDNIPAAWLNIGIAGHATRRVGSGMLVHKITDHASGRNWYPPQVHGLALQTDRLVTVNVPETHYQENALYDMEAAGFYPVACRCCTAELVQCYKVVSDNREHKPGRLLKRRGASLIANCLAEIDTLFQTMDNMVRSLAVRQPAPDTLERYTDRWHFSVTQRHRLVKLLLRWRALMPDEQPPCPDPGKFKQANAVLDRLEQYLDNLPASPV